MSRTTEQVERARAAAELMAQSIDLKIPQAFEDVLAKSELVGPALEAAFPVAAGLAFAAAIADVADKLSRLIADTYIYTDAEKQAYHQLTSQNTELLQIAERTKELRRQRILMEAPDQAAKDKLQLQFQIEDQGGSSKDYAERAKAKMKELADFEKQTVEEVASEAGGPAVVFTQLASETEEGKKKVAELNAEILRFSKLSQEYGEAERIAADETRKHRTEVQQLTGAIKQQEREHQVITVQAQRNRIQAIQQASQEAVADYEKSFSEINASTQQFNNQQLSILMTGINKTSSQVVLANQNTSKKIEADDRASLSRRQKLWDQTFKGISGAFDTFVNGILSGHQKISQAWEKLVESMVTKFIDGLEKQLMSFIQHKLMELTIHTTTEQAKDEASKAAHAKEDERTAYSAAKAA